MSTDCNNKSSVIRRTVPLCLLVWFWSFFFLWGGVAWVQILNLQVVFQMESDDAGVWHDSWSDSYRHSDGEILDSEIVKSLQHHIRASSMLYNRRDILGRSFCTDTSPHSQFYCLVFVYVGPLNTFDILLGIC